MKTRQRDLQEKKQNSPSGSLDTHNQIDNNLKPVKAQKRKADDASNDSSVSSQPKAKKRKKKKSDGAYNRKTFGKKPGKPGDYNKQGILAMRTKNNKTVTLPNGEVDKLRTTVLIDSDITKTNYFSESNKENLIPELQKLIIPKLEKAESFRHTIKVLETTKNNSPVKIVVQTPSKKQPVLTRVAKVKPYHLFSNDPDDTPVLNDPPKKTIPAKRLFEANKNVKENKLDVKEIEFTITPENLRQAKKEIHENGGRRIKSQAQVIAKKGVNHKEASATKYLRTTGLIESDEEAELIHQLDHASLGNKAQVERNLVAGKKPCNTLMIFGESQIPKISSHYPKGFKLKSTAKMIKGSQAAEEIKREIITKDFIHTETFDPFAKNKPHKDFTYVKDDIEAKIEYAEKKRQAPTNQKNNVKKPKKNENDENRFPFFSKAKLKAEQDNIKKSKQPNVKPLQVRNK